MATCSSCHKEVSIEAETCPHCGQPSPTLPIGSISPKSRLAALLLGFFFGMLGIHRFYVGKWGTALIQIITLGGFGIWVLIDLIVICIGSFRDAEGRLLSRW